MFPVEIVGTMLFCSYICKHIYYNRQKEVRKIFLTVCWALTAILTAAAQHHETVNVDAPFMMEPIQVPQFARRDFNIKRYGAVPDNQGKNQKAFKAAIAACHKAGGGRVVVPSGEWQVGPIHLKSHVNLHLEEGAVLRFSDTPQDYLPAVVTSWEGTECMNYSPLIYAYECEDIAITGKGRLEPKMDTWREWFKRPQPHVDAMRQLYVMGATDVPVGNRLMAQGENNMRPHLIHLNRCHGVLLEDFQIRQSPFWTIHLFMCDGGVVRGLDVQAHGHNNDGIDLEMTRNVLVEHCIFDQGDDAVCIKAGRNRDAWRLNMPAENIVIRYCTVKKGHSVLGIGSELSGGVRHIFMHDIEASGSVREIVQIKTNARRGGFVDSIFVDRLHTQNARRVVGIYSDVMYQMRNIVPTFEKRLTPITNIFISNVTTADTEAVYEILGSDELPVRNVSLSNISVGKVGKFLNFTENVIDLHTDNITYTTYTPQKKVEIKKQR